MTLHDDVLPVDNDGEAAARLVITLDAAITACRAGGSVGIASMQSIDQLLDDIGAFLARCDERRPTVPTRPDAIELAILMALAHIYGDKMLTRLSLGIALRRLAHEGGVHFLWCVLWGEPLPDQKLALSLIACRAAFEQVSLRFASVLHADATEVLFQFRLDSSDRNENGNDE